jgi:hypothetical protein
MAQAQTYAPFGETDVPYAEPAWYFGQPTPYYMDKHAKWRKQVCPPPRLPAAACLPACLPACVRAYRSRVYVLFQVRDFVDKELRPFADEWDEGKSFPVEDVRKKAHRAGVLAPWAPAEVPSTAPKPRH